MNKLILALSVAGLVVLGCGQKAPEGSGKLRVLVTTGMIADAVSHIGGDRVEVEALMGPGVDPHLYKASAGDLQKLATAQLILYNGLHLEAKLAEVLEKMSSRSRVGGLAEAIPVDRRLASDPSGKTWDPHVWFDIELWTLVAAEAGRQLALADPAHAAEYQVRTAAYLEQLQAAHRQVGEILQQVPAASRILVTAHDAFHYFGRAYGFEVRGLQGISTVTEAGTRDLQDLADFIVAKKIKAIFIESSVPRKNVEALQAAVHSRGAALAIGGELFSDAMGPAGTDTGTYVGMVLHNASTIAGALK